MAIHPSIRANLRTWLLLLSIFALIGRSGTKGEQPFALRLLLFTLLVALCKQ